MSGDASAQSQVEIGHILFLDIVGFSKFPGDQQNEFSQRLNRVARETEAFRTADAADRLIRLPTGDGMALVFFTGPEAPLQCAMEIQRTLKSSIPLRMGIHSGPVNKMIDVDGRTNVTGSGINTAQRLMDCGDAGHILLSKRIAEDLGHYTKWRPNLHELGEAEVKHGAKIDIFNFYGDEIGNPAIPERLRTRRAKPPLAKRSALVSLTVAVLIGVAFLAYRTRSTSTVVSAPEKSVAIFPFKPLAAQNRDEVLENGMADTLIAKLSTTRDIIIPSLTSARKYDEQEHDPLVAGRLLHVRSVLEGTLQKFGDRIRVSARLINVTDGTSAWTGTFDEKFTDVFAVQDRIAQKVADALRVRLSGEEQQRLTKRYTENTEAYQLYLKGRFYWNKFTEEGFRKSIEYFKEALDKDPNYALAYSGLADSYSLISELGFLAPNDAFPKARSYAQKALELDDALSDAHLSLGIVKLFYDQDLPAAEKELLKAKELNPNNVQAFHFYAHYLQFVDRFDDAIAEIKRAAMLDPTSSIISYEIGNAYWFARDFDQSIAAWRETLQLDSNFSEALIALAVAYEMKGKYQEALTVLDKLSINDSSDPTLQAERARVYAKSGRQAEARRIVNDLNELAARQTVDPLAMAWAYIGLGDKDQAFKWLEKAYQERVTLVWLKIDPVYDPLRSDPRFTGLLQRIGQHRSL